MYGSDEPGAGGASSGSRSVSTVNVASDFGLNPLLHLSPWSPICPVTVKCTVRKSTLLRVATAVTLNITSLTQAGKESLSVN